MHTLPTCLLENLTHPFAVLMRDLWANLDHLPSFEETLGPKLTKEFDHALKTNVLDLDLPVTLDDGSPVALIRVFRKKGECQVSVTLMPRTYDMDTLVEMGQKVHAATSLSKRLTLDMLEMTL